MNLNGATWEEKMENLAGNPHRMEMITEGEKFLKYLISIGADWDETEDKWRLFDDGDEDTTYYKHYTTQQLFEYYTQNKRP